ncbi:MAG: Uxx-star family glutaredoxin-like (seleno)protein [bacterium]
MSKITVYTKVGCPHCEAALRYFKQEKMAYEEIDVYDVSGAEAEALEHSGGKRRVPIIVRDGEVEVGFRGGS